jgi:hypothetical protein
MRRRCYAGSAGTGDFKFATAASLSRPLKPGAGARRQRLPGALLRTPVWGFRSVIEHTLTTIDTKQPSCNEIVGRANEHSSWSGHRRGRSMSMAMHTLYGVVVYRANGSHGVKPMLGGNPQQVLDHGPADALAT